MTRWLTFPALAVVALVWCAGIDTNASGTAHVPASVSPVDSSADASAGRTLFLKNCAHCHGADGRGDEGPDLHGLDWTDEQIAARIRNGKAGKMTAFGGKLSPERIRQIIAYLRTLR